ncbi:hypothetical protein CLOP_g24405 [Closterium sp. NIES-67]|nr:hypothetical protein CLOP_g24405 [Closterium sp. NIES-67]
MPLRTVGSMLTFPLVLLGACFADGAKTSIYKLWDSPLLENKYVMSAENVWKAYPAASVVVSADGCGNFTSVQDAVDYVSSMDTKMHTVIDILPGTYREKVLIPKSKVSIMLRGSNPLETIISYDDYAARELSNGYVLGTLWSCSVCVEANNFVAVNITFQNSAPPPPPFSNETAEGPMAVALRISGTMAAFYSCRFIGWQDTLYDHKGLHYFRDCYIEGNVDFVFGDATSTYEGCVFYAKARKHGGAVTAQYRRSTAKRSGFVFLRSIITGNGRVYLGRAWGNASRAVYAWSFINNIVQKGGWYDWGDASRHATTFFAMVRADPFFKA